MKVSFLSEPELDFGNGRHVDIRFGISDYGPHDVGEKLAPREIRVGIVGVPEHTELATAFLERCRTEIPGAQTRQPNLRPPFPGFTPEAGFCSTLSLSDRLTRTIPARRFEDLRRTDDANRMVRESVSQIIAEFEYLHRNERPDVLMCAVPQQLVDLMNPDLRPAIAPGEFALNFRSMLKASAMHLPPIQLMLPSTSDPTRARKAKKTKVVRQIQDDATRAWNLHSALYYKARGRPWRLPRDSTAFTTCFVGISFYHALDRSTVLTSMAQVFDERGDGVIVQGGRAEVSKDDRTPHLSEPDAHDLLRQALREYRATHGTLPARVVIHKTSSFTPTELAGFRTAAVVERIDRLDAISVSDGTSHRVFRYGAYPPLRGTLLALDERDHLLYTRGSVEFYATYPGLYVPLPLLFRCEDVEQGPQQIAREMLGLSKLNWNQTQFDGGVPITVVAARQVGGILKYVDLNPDPPKIAARYSHYM
jgi:hypothetical protein